MSVDEHEDWPEVPMDDFREYLKTCPDFKGNGFGQVEFRHSGEVFAVYFDKSTRVRVSPKILAK